MDVVSAGPFRVASLLWQSRPAAWTLTVVCKATYRLLPGVAELAASQEEPNDEDNYWNDDPSRSLHAPSDLVPFKPQADVVLVGHAFAPHQEPVRSLLTRLSVDGIDKSIEVFGERAWTSVGLLREGAPFAKMPLRYERAAFGPENPAGIRPDAPPDTFGMVPLPNLQPPGRSITTRRDAIAPTGFGPIAPTWPARAVLYPKPATNWPMDVQRQALPEGIDPSFFNVAPHDQRLDTLSPDERILLQNLHPEHPRLVTCLPGVYPVAQIESPSAVAKALLMRADTLWIDSDRAICTLTWRGHVRLDSLDQPGRVLISVETAARHSRPELETHRVNRPSQSTGSHGPQPGVQPSDPSETMELHCEKPAGDPSEEADTLGPALAKKPIRVTLPRPPYPHGAPALTALPFVKSSESTPALSAIPRTVPEAPRRAEDGSATITASFGSGASSVDLPFVDVQRPVTMPDLSAPATPPPALIPRPPLIRPPLTISSDVQSSAPPLTVGQAAALAKEVSPPPLVNTPTSGGIEPPPLIAPTKGSSRGQDKAPAAPSEKGSAARPKVAPLTRLKQLPAAQSSTAPSAAAALNSAAQASNAAAAGAAPPEPERTPGPVPSLNMRTTPRAVIELLWVDATFLDAIRAQPKWKEIVAALKPKPRDADFDDKAPPARRQEAKDRREITGVLARGEPTDAEGLSASLAEAVDEDGTFVPPLVLVGGELEFPFDELETLKATIAAVTPLIAGDKKLKETIDTVNELLKTPWLQAASSMAEGFTGQIKEVFAQGHRALPPRYVETHTERMLLEQRHYQMRAVFGQPWLRSLLALPAGSSPVPVYLPGALARELPMFQRLQVRLIAEVRVQLDQHESSPSALRVVALGRVLSGVGR